MPSLSREAFLVSMWLSVSATWLCCVKGEGLDSVSSIGVLPFIEGSLGDGTSGLVASSRDSEEHA